MCHKGTVAVPVLLLTLAFGAFAQTPTDWRKVGSSAVDLGLASPAGGPVEQVWFSADAGTLYARTASGRTLQTNDFEMWKDAGAMGRPPLPPAAAVVRLPETAARLVSSITNPNVVFALGTQLWRSEDAGHSWTNLTAFKSQSVVGPGQHSVAISPTNPDELVLANDYGVWRSMDGGMTWSGLNQDLPNLPVRRILSAGGGAGTRVLAAGIGGLELAPGTVIWEPVQDQAQQREETLERQYSAMVGAEITAVAAAGETVYIGSGEGRLWVSNNRGQTFQPTQTPLGTSGRVERIFVDGTAPRVALAALSNGPHHVLRTTNNGAFWDALDFNLPAAPVYSVTADRAAGAVYVATEKGVFYGHTDLNNATSDPINWQSLMTDKLPAARATDVRLDPAGIQLYAALDGYGVYATAAPHVLRSLRLVNAADFSTRPAAPGSLVSVIGARINGATASSLTYPVLAASDSESQIQVPFEAVGPNVALALQTPTGSVTMGLAVQPLSPAILVSRDGTPALFDSDTELPVDGRNTAHSNGRIKVMLTGLGKVRPDWPTGMQAPMDNPPAVIAPVKAFLDGQPIQVLGATLAPGYIGFYVVEVQLPAVNNLGTSELYVSADGHDSNKVQIVIEP